MYRKYRRLVVSSCFGEEIESRKKNPTWVYINLPRNHKMVRCKWVFKNVGFMQISGFRHHPE